MGNMRRVEFLGPPYAGKTTLYEALLARRGNAAWRTQDEAKLEALRVLSGSLFTRFLSALPSRSLRAHALRALEAHKKKILWARKENYEDFLNAALTGLQSNRKYPLRYLWAAQKLVNNLSDLALLEEAKVEGVVVFESGSLGFQAWNAMYLPESGRDAVEEWFQTMPLPAGVVHLTVSPETLMERVHSRGEKGMNIWHRAMSDKEIYARTKSAIDICAIGADILRARGSKVLEVDTSAHSSEILRRVKEFLKSA